VHGDIISNLEFNPRGNLNQEEEPVLKKGFACPPPALLPFFLLFGTGTENFTWFKKSFFKLLLEITFQKSSQYIGMYVSNSLHLTRRTIQYIPTTYIGRGNQGNHKRGLHSVHFFSATHCNHAFPSAPKRTPTLQS
jgi:hypothetical protein